MGTSVSTLKSWFERGVAQEATHMIVVCDTFDWDDYPVYILPDEDKSVRERYNEFNGKNMQKVMEVYKISLGWEAQSQPGGRVFNF